MSINNNTLENFITHNHSVQSIKYLSDSLEGYGDIYPVFHTVSQQLEKTYNDLQKQVFSAELTYDEKIKDLVAEVDSLRSELADLRSSSKHLQLASS